MERRSCDPDLISLYMREVEPAAELVTNNDGGTTVVFRDQKEINQLPPWAQVMKKELAMKLSGITYNTSKGMYEYIKPEEQLYELNLQLLNSGVDQLGAAKQIRQLRQDLERIQAEQK